MDWKETTLKVLFKKPIGPTGNDHKVFKHPGWDDDERELNNNAVCWSESEES
jgi:hypothetical protein